MSAPQVYGELLERAPIYRQSVNKALETLKDCGLLTKYYDDSRKAIYYHLEKKTYIVKIDQMRVD